MSNAGADAALPQVAFQTERSENEERQRPSVPISRAKSSPVIGGTRVLVNCHWQTVFLMFFPVFHSVRVFINILPEPGWLMLASLFQEKMNPCQLYCAAGRRQAHVTKLRMLHCLCPCTTCALCRRIGRL